MGEVEKRANAYPADERGRFVGGTPGPGRPAGRSLTRAINEHLARIDPSDPDKAATFKQRIVEQLFLIALNGSKERDRLAAIQEILNRAEGKPKELVDGNTTVRVVWGGVDGRSSHYADEAARGAGEDSA